MSSPSRNAVALVRFSRRGCRRAKEALLAAVLGISIPMSVAAEGTSAPTPKVPDTTSGAATQAAGAEASSAASGAATPIPPAPTPPAPVTSSLQTGTEEAPAPSRGSGRVLGEVSFSRQEPAIGAAVILIRDGDPRS